jgi:pimeloyl-ACP methyl ester carboxylesterase
VTVHALDRRGRGASGDGTDYSLAREHEDVAAVVDAVAEDQAILDGVFHPEQAARMTAPTLLLVGGDSPASLRAGYEGLAAALPDARVTVLDGQQHIAHAVIPDVFAGHVLWFLEGND